MKINKGSFLWVKETILQRGVVAAVRDEPSGPVTDLQDAVEGTVLYVESAVTTDGEATDGVRFVFYLRTHDAVPYLRRSRVRANQPAGAAPRARVFGNGAVDDVPLAECGVKDR